MLPSETSKFWKTSRAFRPLALTSLFFVAACATPAGDPAGGTIEELGPLKESMLSLCWSMEGKGRIAEERGQKYLFGVESRLQHKSGRLTWAMGVDFPLRPQELFEVEVGPKPEILTIPTTAAKESILIRNVLKEVALFINFTQGLQSDVALRSCSLTSAKSKTGTCTLPDGRPLNFELGSDDALTMELGDMPGAKSQEQRGFLFKATRKEDGYYHLWEITLKGKAFLKWSSQMTKINLFLSQCQKEKS